MSYDVKRKAIDRTKNLGVKIDYGPHLALVVNNNDSLYSGTRYLMRVHFMAYHRTAPRRK